MRCFYCKEEVNELAMFCPHCCKPLIDPRGMPITDMRQVLRPVRKGIILAMLFPLIPIVGFLIAYL